MNQRSLLVVSNDRLLADAARALFEERDGWRVAGVTEDAIAALASIARLSPDAVLVLGRLARMSQKAFARQVTTRGPDSTVVIVGSDDNIDRVHALPAGADTGEILDALASPPPTAGPVTGGGNEGVRRLASLTPRERSILKLAAQGSSMAEIATDLGVSEHTVRTHMQNLYSKLGCHTRVEMVRFAADHGIVTGEQSGGLR